MTTDQLTADLDLLAGLAAERLLDLKQAGAATTHRQVAQAAQAAHARLAAALAPQQPAQDGADSHG